MFINIEIYHTVSDVACNLSNLYDWAASMIKLELVCIL